VGNDYVCPVIKELFGIGNGFLHAIGCDARIQQFTGLFEAHSQLYIGAFYRWRYGRAFTGSAHDEHFRIVLPEIIEQRFHGFLVELVIRS